MFGGLLSIRFKSAERALHAGRLDDAFRIASEPEIARHSRAGNLLKDLAQAYVNRAREHYRAERFKEALLDLGKASQCGGSEAEIAELRAQVNVVAHEVARQDADRKRRVEQARRFVDHGSLAAGKQLLQSMAADDQDLAQIKKDIASRERRAADLLSQAEALFKAQRTDAAAEHLQRALKLDAHGATALDLESRICKRAVQEARNAFDAGRLDRARQSLSALAELGRHDDGRAELETLLRHADDTTAALRDGQFETAQQRIRRLQQLAPKVSWVKQAVADIDRVDSALLALRSGPLGEGNAKATPILDQNLRETVMIPRNPVIASREPLLSKALLLMVDGGGSYLLHRGERVSVGRVASSNPADIAIFSDLSERHAELVRVEDDTFVMSSQEFEVAGMRTRQHLLRDGDRVSLARRAKFTHRLPNRRSASAVLEMSDSTRVPNDVRRVILFRGTAMIGRSRGCHVTAHGAQCDLVLFERGGSLWVRPQNRGGSEAIAVELGQSLELEGVSFVVRPWTRQPLGTSRIS